ncbi:NADH dehydrogenase subunit 5 (mitochondrion) [Malaclemys terrapin terrapin]|uniref:NADH-ubiquinone oxidoreductase chain 5 n=1 Tax=Malaclemys terrapin terrapin TaxID=391341 RepID=A0A1C9U0C3_MALTE|nr:NADH dehydrogenase subunit 5 [Malaclemys terrapin terrapin]AOR16341.1 NADH dehydrogenase subunit 5 [Malaclemys terrapin terrapin]
MCLANTFLLLALLTLTMPLIVSLFMSKTWLILKTESTVKTTFYISLIPLLHSMLFPEQTLCDVTLLGTSLFSIKLNFIHDQYSAMFMPIALYVTWAILQYSRWYMMENPHIDKFFKYLLFFLMAMMILITSNNLFQFFIGWEGVGIMSFLLIGWWRGREETLLSALMAIIYNRIGDFGLYIGMAWLIANTNSLNFQPLSYTNPPSLLTLLALILAATGKSAQFGLHPWLPAAMEGPTPVSALLHSSTMVVAGIFLLIRVHPLLASNNTALSICLCLGAITTFFASLSALSQNDLKKIIAYSTTSQLGLMMITIGLNQPDLAFLHICMHAFFKAMLFMCAGFIIHSLNNEQDIRKMGGLHKPLPITSACLTIGNMALMGMPFLTGYYSKDAIIETMSTSYLNTFALLMTLMATSFTALYTLRIMLLVQTGHPLQNSTYLLHENIPTIMNPITRLATGSIVAGWLITKNIQMLNTPTTTMPMWIKIAALTVTVIGLLVGFKVICMATKMPLKPSKPCHPTSMAAYLNYLAHRSVSKNYLKMAQKIATHLADTSWFEYLGPKVTAKWQKTPMRFTSLMQKGLIKIYMTSFLLTLSTMLIMIIVLSIVNFIFP